MPPAPEMLMYSLKSGSSTQLPKGFKDMMDTIGKRDHIKSNRDTLSSEQFSGQDGHRKGTA